MTANLCKEDHRLRFYAEHEHTDSSLFLSREKFNAIVALLSANSYEEKVRIEEHYAGIVDFNWRHSKAYSMETSFNGERYLAHNSKGKKKRVVVYEECSICFIRLMF